MKPVNLSPALEGKVNFYTSIFKTPEFNTLIHQGKKGNIVLSVEGNDKKLFVGLDEYGKEIQIQKRENFGCNTIESYIYNFIDEHGYAILRTIDKKNKQITNSRARSIPLSDIFEDMFSPSENTLLKEDFL